MAAPAARPLFEYASTDGSLPLMHGPLLAAALLQAPTVIAGPITLMAMGAAAGLLLSSIGGILDHA